MAHVICVGHTRAEMRDLLKNYSDAGVQNIMALGGDIPDDPSAATSEFEHAIDLIDLAREIGDFSVASPPIPPAIRVARPRVGPPFPRREAGPGRLRRHAVLLRGRRIGPASSPNSPSSASTKPVLPGHHARDDDLGHRAHEDDGRRRARPRSSSGSMAAEQRGGADAVRAEGIRAAIELCRELLEADAPGLHFYTLNRSTATSEIYHALFGVLTVAT